jgi:uncharacterized protein YjcR
MAGQPRKFKTPEAMQKAIDAYFEKCDKATKQIYDSRNGIVTIPAPKPYTIEGLANTLNVDPETIRNYEKTAGYEEYFGTVKKAKQKIQQNKVEGLLSGEYSTAGAIFDLTNNHGYTNRQHQTIEGLPVPPKTIEVEAKPE